MTEKNRTKTLTWTPLYQSVFITGEYVRKHKDGRKFFDLKKAAFDLAKELISSGALQLTEVISNPHNDFYTFRAIVSAAIKRPGIEGVDE